jgi:peroxiredoxin
MPSIQDLYNDYKNEVVFLMISDEENDIIKKYMKKHDYNFEIYQPLSESPDILNNRSIPRTFLIDKNGNILIDKSGAANWNSEKVRETIDGLVK